LGPPGVDYYSGSRPQFSAIFPSISLKKGVDSYSGTGRQCFVIFPSNSLKRGGTSTWTAFLGPGGGLLFGRGTNKEGGPLLGGVTTQLCGELKYARTENHSMLLGKKNSIEHQIWNFTTKPEDFTTKTFRPQKNG